MLVDILTNINMYVDFYAHYILGFIFLLKFQYLFSDIEVLCKYEKTDIHQLLILKKHRYMFLLRI